MTPTSVLEIRQSQPEIIEGIPRVPVLVLESLSTSSISPFVARNAVWGGISLVISSNAPERASRSLLRPAANIIELGPFRKGDYDILGSLCSMDGYIRHNGIIIKTDRNKHGYIADQCRHLGIRRAMLHFHTTQLIEAMEKMGLSVHESLSVYENLGKKSNFNNALEEFSGRHTDSTIGRFGVNFNGLDEMVDEIIRLARYGLRACVKVDQSDEGFLSDSGAGVYFFPDFFDFNSPNRVKDCVRMQLGQRGFQEQNLAGLVQMYVPNSTILSVSSGQTSAEEYAVYEAHTQTQIFYQKGDSVALTADGGIPLADDQYSKELLTLTWPQLAKFYNENNVTGDQNMNFIVLPPDLLALARQLYHNDRLSVVVPIDLNPRPISGTKRIMGRFSEETLQPINYRNFAAKSLRVDPFFAANPHLVYLAAESFGLHAGKGGNMSLTNFGTLIPERIRNQYNKIYLKIFIQDVPDPVGILGSLEEIISQPPTALLIKKTETKIPEEIPDADADQEYESWLEEQLTKVFAISS